MWLKEHKTLLQGLALLMILGLPFLLYVAAQTNQQLLMGLGTGLMTLVMIALISLS